MRYLLDTNVISEVRLGAKCNPSVARWFASVASGQLWISTMVLGELHKGLVMARLHHPSNPTHAFKLERWIESVRISFATRVLGITLEIAREWGRMNAVGEHRGHRPDKIDSLLAATARVYGMTLVTRNIKHVKRLDVELLNPFQ